jgi:transcriptional regulator with XRE-family HTH domain
MVSDRRGLGARLKRQRERTGVSLQKIAESSKVSASLFAGLEAGDCSRWPSGLYARAYVRAYAEAIGLNADDIVEEFAGAYEMAAKPAAVEGPPASATRTLNPLRLALVDESPIELEGLSRRAGLAAVDILIGFLIAAVATVGLGQGVWVSVALIVGYFGVGRLISDDPLLYHLYRRLRVRSTAPEAAAEPAGEIAPVGDAASTVA